MAVTTLLNSINRSTTYPISINAEAEYNCGMLQLILNGTWSEKMIYELPAINICIYTVDDSKYLTFDINMETVNRELTTLPPTQPYSIPIYNIPKNFKFSITPLFDESALESHNNLLETGVTGVDNYVVWSTFTQTFDIVIAFDDSNVKAGGEGGSGQTVSAADVTFDTSGTSLTSTNVQDAIEEVQTNIDNLPEPMIFKGSLGTSGTITTLPEAAETNKGFTYKVITAGTYQGVAAEVGDTVISDGTAWILIPSGDEPSGTVTNVAVTSADGSATITGSPITSSGIIDVSVNIDSSYDANSTKPVTNSLLTRTMTPRTQSEYDALTNKDLPLYFIYEE